MYNTHNLNLNNIEVNNDVIHPRLLSINQFMLYCGMGRNRATEYAKEHGWIVQFGRRIFVDKVAFDKYIDQSICS